MPDDPVPGAGRAAAEAYCAAVNAKDAAALRALFAAGATLVNPFGTYQGIDEILGFYESLAFANDVTVEATNIVDSGTQCAVELDGRTPATPDVQQMVDVFTVDSDGRVSRLSIYRR